MRVGIASVDTQKMVSQRQLLRTETGVGCMFRITLQLLLMLEQNHFSCLLLEASVKKGKCRLGKRSGHKPLLGRRYPDGEYLGQKRIPREAVIERYEGSLPKELFHLWNKGASVSSRLSEAGVP